LKPNDVLKFWFEELTPKQWFEKSDAIDGLIRKRFLPVHEQASQCELSEWRNSPEGRLAEVIVLDQFSRNLFRGQPQSFAHDSLALALAQEAIHVGDDQKVTPAQRVFLYMPFMHSESKKIHERAVVLYQSLKGFETNLNFEMRHKAIIDRFGRFPHRNAILGRFSTPEELEFLKQPGSSF
jgi:uncharacterized protein (DUF924 family)